MDHLAFKFLPYGVMADVAGLSAWSGDNMFKRSPMRIVTGDTGSRSHRPMDELSFSHLRMALIRGTGGAGNHLTIGGGFSLQVVTILALFLSLQWEMDKIGLKSFGWFDIF